MKKLLTGLVLLWCLTGLSAPAVADKPLVVYSAVGDASMKPVFERFTANTGIEVVVHTGGSKPLLEKLRADAEHAEADVFISDDVGNLQIGADSGIFSEIDSKVIDDLPATLRAPDNSWVGLARRLRVLVSHSGQQVMPQLGSVFDLADPRLKGHLAISQAGDQSFVAGVTVYMLAAGSELTRHWLQGMRDNSTGKTFTNDSDIIAVIAAGQKEIGLVNHDAVSRYLDQQPEAPLTVIIPDQGEGIGVAWNMSGVAISRYSAQPSRALQLVEFLLSEQGQKLLVEASREYPVRTGAGSVGDIPALDQIKIADVPMAALGRNRRATVDLIEAAGLR